MRAAFFVNNFWSFLCLMTVCVYVKVYYKSNKNPRDKKRLREVAMAVVKSIKEIMGQLNKRNLIFAVIPALGVAVNYGIKKIVEHET